MTNKRVLAKKPIEKNIWSGDNWSVIYGELRKGPGRPSSIKPLFQYVGEKIPFGALREVEKICHSVRDSRQPVNLVIEAPLSVTFNEQGNPKGRRFC